MRLVAVATLAAIVMSCVGQPAEDATGREIYLQVCANCHGSDLAGGLGPSLGVGSNAALQPDEFLRVTISQGRGRMPSFTSSLDDAQIDRVIGYLREVQAD